MIIPVYKYLAAHTDFQQTILGLTTAKIPLERNNIPYISFKDLIGNNEQAKKYGELLAKGQTPHPEISREETIAYLGLSFFDLANQFGETEASRLYKEKGRGGFLPTGAIESVISQYQPDIIVTTNSPRAERAALLKAKELGIPSVCIVDICNLDALKNELSKPQLSTKICVINDFARKHLIEFGRPAEEICVTGNPSFDRLSEPAAFEGAIKYQQKHNLQNKKVFLWTRSVLPEDEALANKIEAHLIDMALKDPSYAFIMRPHPNDPRREIPQAENIIYSDHHDDLAAVLHSCDIVCTLYSTVGIEASLVGSKVIQFTNTRIFQSIDFVTAGIAEGVSTVEEMETTIKNFQKDSTIRNVVNIVPAAKKVAQVIEELLD